MKQDDRDLVLINPGARHAIYQALENDLSAVEPPVWAGLIATFIRKRGFSVSILDANAERLGPEEVAQRIDEMNPRLTAVVVYGHQPSASTQNMVASGAICSALKKRRSDLNLILVGGHVAALPERTLREEDADFVCQGEGPYTLLDLLQALDQEDPDLSKVRGIGYREGAAVRFTAPAPLVWDLDGEMPGIAWDLLPMDRYRAHNWHCFGAKDRQPYAAIYTTLGCPYRCTFCCIQAPFKSGEAEAGKKANVNSYRRFSVDSVMAEIDLLVREYDVQNIKFADELFVLNDNHVGDICDAIIKRGYDLNIWAYARVDSVRDEMLAKLKRAGVTWLALGIEAGGSRVRDHVNKGFQQDRALAVVEKSRAAGMHVIGNFIFGLPEDDLESMQATLDMALDLNCEFINLYCAMGYPGSELYEMAQREGWPLPQDWTGFSQHSVDCLPLPTKYLTAGEVLRFRDDAFHTYFSSPRYLKMIEQRFGPETCTKIQKMTSLRLRRKYAAPS